MGSPEGIYGYAIGQIFSSPYETWTVYHEPYQCDLHLHSSSLQLQFQYYLCLHLQIAQPSTLP